MAERVPEDLPLPGERGVDEDDAGDRRDEVVERHVEPPGPATQPSRAVEEEEAHEPEPEDRDRVAEEAHDADHLVGQPAPAHRGDHAAWGSPSTTPISVATVASSSVAGKNRRMSTSTGLEVSTERPKSPTSTLRR